MLGIMLDDKHSFHDLKLWLKSYPKISSPTPKTKFVDVPGADGALNMSKTLTGYMHYNRRTFTAEFTIIAPRAHWPEIHSEILDLLHGREMSISLDDDPEYCYTGLVSVQDPDPDKVTSSITITADVEPYKTRREDTHKTVNVNSSAVLTITGSRMPTVPKIWSSTAMSMAYGGKTYALASGDNLFPDVIIREGSNTFTFTGSGTVTLEFREGRF